MHEKTAGRKKKRVSLGKCFELVVCKTVLLGLFLWGGGLETYSRQVLLVQAFAHFADTRVVLKVEKSELLAFCLLSLVKPNPFSHSSASEQSVQILPSFPLLFQAMLSLSALPSPVWFWTPYPWRGFASISCGGACLGCGRLSLGAGAVTSSHRR